MKIKLLGRALLDADGKIIAYVAPHFVPEKEQIAGVDDVFNGIVVRGNAVGDTMFYGRGAGKLPTASAVVADIIDAANHTARRKKIGWEDGGPDVIGDFRALPMRWFVRTDEPEDKLLAALPGAALLKPVGGQSGAITAPMTLHALEACGLHNMERMPVLD